MSDWWAQRLGGGGSVPQTVSPPSAAPSYQSPQQPGQWVPQAAPAPAAQGWKVTPGNLIESMSNWRGGEGARNSATCPGCGGSNLFRRKVGGSEAAPLCYDCGYNGLWTQVQPRT